MESSFLKRILLVDNDVDIATVARLALQAIGGFTVEVRHSAQDALQAAAELAPDLILLDVTLRDTAGHSVFQALRQIPEAAPIPVIFVTTKVQPAEVTRLMEMGALGVIAKPFDPMTLAHTVRNLWAASQEVKKGHRRNDIEEQLRLLRRDYIERVGGKIHQIDEVWNNLQQATSHQTATGNELLKTLHRLAHTLAGSGATFGFATLSAAARSLESYLRAIIEEAALPGAVLQSEEQRGEVAVLLNTLRQASFAASLELDHGTSLPPLITLAAPGSVSWREPERRQIFILDEEREPAESIAQQLARYGYGVSVFDCLDAMTGVMQQDAPAALIIEIKALERIGEAALRQVQQGRDTPLPIVFLASRGDMSARLQAVRAGGNAYFTKPVDVDTLADKLNILTAHPTLEPFRILVVDDEPALANLYSLILQQAGMITAVVHDPLQVMQPLVEFRPDLILLDMHMAACNGVELAGVIRQQEAYVSIPIVFLSSEINVNRQVSALRLGGDDYLSKPVEPDHLVSSVIARAQRSRILRSFMVRDSLTGLLNHTRTKEQLGVELARARRLSNGLAFAMIDLDHFKAVNDTYGHPAGDRVLKSLSRLLQQRLRKTDIIGRYGGEEFAVILNGADGANAAKVLDRIRIDFGEIHHQADEGEFSVTMSCGIAAVSHAPGDESPYKDANDLNEAADKALYEAKRAGRNRVVLAAS